MEAKTIAPPTPATRLPGPPELIPGRPDAVVDLQTGEGAGVVAAAWRYSDARVEEIDFVELGSPEDPLGPGTVPNRTYDVVPHAEAPDYDDSRWRDGRARGRGRRLRRGLGRRQAAARARGHGRAGRRWVQRTESRGTHSRR